jgi:hypothetical protein
MSLYKLQYGWWGFRIDGGFLYSYPTKEEAIAAYWRIMGKDI